MCRRSTACCAVSSGSVPGANQGEFPVVDAVAYLLVQHLQQQEGALFAIGLLIESLQTGKVALLDLDLVTATR